MFYILIHVCVLLTTRHVLNQNDPDWALRVWQIGTRDNLGLDARKTHDFVDMICSIHYKRVAWEKDLGRCLTKGEVTKFKKGIIAATHIAPGLYGHYWAFAKTSGPYWEAFEAILRGQVTSSVRFKKATSLSLFHSCRGLAESDVVPVFQEVIHGVLTLKQMSTKFVTMKLVAKVRGIVATFLGVQGCDTKKHVDDIFLDWEALQADPLIPTVFHDDELVRVWAETALRLQVGATADIPGFLDHLRGLWKAKSDEVRLHVYSMSQT